MRLHPASGIPKFGKNLVWRKVLNCKVGGGGHLGLYSKQEVGQGRQKPVPEADGAVSIGNSEKNKLFYSYFTSIVFINENNLQTCNVEPNSGKRLETQLP